MVALKQKIPLYLVVLVPLCLEILIGVGVVGWIAYLNNRAATNDVILKLQNKAIESVERDLDYRLNLASQTLAFNAKSLEMQLLGNSNRGITEKYFLQQLHKGSDISQIYIGKRDGSIILAGVNENGKLYTFSTTRFPVREKYEVDRRGKYLKLLQAASFDVRTRPWFTSIAPHTEHWTPIYTYANGDIGISLSKAIYDSNLQLTGVVGVDITLEGIQQFLQRKKK